MKANIVAIGNSQGIRIPKALLEESGLSGEIELELVKEGILISRAKHSRSGWEQAFEKAGDAVEDEIGGDGANQSSFDKKEWRW